MAFSQYAARVKKLRVGGETRIPIRRFTQEPLLPNLRQLTWYLGPDVLDIFPLLQSPIEILVVDGCCDTYYLALNTLFNFLPSLLPNLRSLSLKEGSDGVPIVPDTLHDKLPHLSHLHSFRYDAPVISDDLLLGLSRLPTLLRLDLQNIPQVDLRQFDVCSFPALEILTIRAGGDRTPTFLSRVTSCHLRDFRVRFRYGEFSKVTNTITILATSHYLSLRRCVIEGQCRLDLDWDASILAPLYSCGLLEKFEFNFSIGKPVVLHDTDLEKMAVGWPRLKVLRITQTWSDNIAFLGSRRRAWGDRDPATTLRGLHSFVERCVDLVEVMINLDETTPSVPPTSLSSSFSVRSLHLLNSPCGSVEGIVAFLNHAFPRLYHLDLHTKDEGWQEVIVRLPHTQRWPAPRVNHTPNERDGLFD